VPAIGRVFQTHLNQMGESIAVDEAFAIGNDPDRTMGYLCEGYIHCITSELVLAIQATIQQGWMLWRVILELESDMDGNPALIIYPTGFVEQRTGCLGVSYKACEIRATHCNGAECGTWFKQWHQHVASEVDEQ